MKNKLLYPKPKRVKGEIGSIYHVTKFRKMDCMFYNVCLSHAAYLQWSNFSCMKCNLYISNPEYLKELEMDFTNCIKVASQVSPKNRVVLNKSGKLKLKRKSQEIKGKLKLKRISELKV